jgi:hypothetical protein
MGAGGISRGDGSGARPETAGKCEFVIGYEVQEGRYGDVDLRGFRAVVVAKAPYRARTLPTSYFFSAAVSDMYRTVP